MMWARVGSSLVALCAIAHADPAQDADEAFKKGRELFKTGQYREACAEFEKSERLDPQLGTQFNIAQCDEKIGKLIAAVALYTELADKDTNATRKAAATQLAAALAARVPKLLVQIQVPGAKILLDGKLALVPNKPMQLDPGKYTVTVTATGFQDFTATAECSENRTTKLAVALTPTVIKSEHPQIEFPDRHAPPPPEPSQRTTYAIGAVALGGASVVTGLVFGALAHSKWNDAKAVCGGSTSCATPLLQIEAEHLANQARTRGNLATGFVIAGLVAAGAGVALWLTAPGEPALVVAPRADGAAAFLSGRF